MATRKPNKYHLLLLVTEHQDEQELTRKCLLEAGYEDDQIVIEGADKAMDYLFSRGDYTGMRQPSLVMVDLDHTKNEDRALLAQIVEEIKSHQHYRLIPVVLLLREKDADYVLSWYRMGIHACVFRPDDAGEMTETFERIRDYWSKKVILPELE